MNYLIGQRHFERLDPSKTRWSTAFRRLCMSIAIKAAKAWTPAQSVRYLFCLTLSQIAVAVTLSSLATVQMRAADLTSLLDPSASLLVRVDIAKFDAPRLLQVVGPIIGEQSARQILPAQSVISAAVQSLRDAEVDELVISFAAQDLSQSFPAFIVPTLQPDRVKDVVQSLLAMAPPELGLQLHQHPIGLVVAHPSTWQRMESQANVQPSGLRAHYQDRVDATLSVTLGFNRDVKDAVVEIWPEQLPPELGFAISPRQLMRDIDAISLTCELHPKFSLEIMAACSDAQSSKQIVDELQPIVTAAGLTLARKWSALTVTMDQEKLNALLGPLLLSGPMSPAQMQVSNNMKRIVLALHNFYSAFQTFPPRKTVDENGRGLLSWRVFLLPYLGEEALYKQFRLNEPWDSPHNRTLVDKMPAVFADVDNPSLPLGHTRLQMVLTEGSVWNGNEDRLIRFQDITDGTSNTVCFLVAPKGKSVVWSQPVDFEVSKEGLVEVVFAGRETVQAAYFDGSIRPLSLETAELLHSQLTGNGGEVIQP